MAKVDLENATGECAMLRKAKKCAGMMRMARNDTDRIAVLALIPEIMQTCKEVSDEEDAEAMLLIAQSISVDFMERLLSSPEIDGDTVAVNVLARLLSSPPVVSSNKFDELTPSLIDTLRKCTTASVLSATTDSNLDIGLYCCKQLARSCALSSDFWSFLVDLLASEPLTAMDAAFEIYLKLSNAEERLKAAVNMQCFMVPLTARVKNTQDEQHFIMLGRLTKWLHLMAQHSDESVPFFTSSATPGSDWTGEIRLVITHILQSLRVGDRERRLALVLAASMSKGIGNLWLIIDPKFTKILTRITSIELRMFLDRHPTQIASGIAESTEEHDSDLNYLLHCCQFLETVIICAADSGQANSTDESVSDKLSEEVASDINLVLIQIVDFLLGYFSIANNCAEELPNSIIIPIYRLICSYLCEGLELVDKIALKDAAKELLRIAQLTDNEFCQDFDGLQFLLPALLQLAETGEDWTVVRKAFVDCDVFAVLENYSETSPQMRELCEDVIRTWRNTGT